MKQKLLAMLLFLLLCMAINVNAEDNPPEVELKSQKQKVSYIIGQNAGQFLKQQNYDYDLTALFAGIEDVLKGSPAKMTDEQVKTAMDQFKKDMWEVLGKKNRQEGLDFLKENRSPIEVIDDISPIITPHYHPFVPVILDNQSSVISSILRTVVSGFFAARV